MAFTTQDAHSMLQALYRITTKMDPPSTIDTSNFVDCGTTILNTGYHNILEGLSVLVGRDYYNSRKYTGKWSIALKKDNDFAYRSRKISFYHGHNDPASCINTNLNPDNLYEGGNASSGAGGMFEDFKFPRVLEQYFFSSNATREHITIPEVQLQDAFRSEEDFIKFMEFYMLEFKNEVELREQGINQYITLSRMAGNYLLKNKIPESVVNIRKIYKDWTGKNYTSEELYKEHLLDLLKTFTSKLQIDSDKMEYLTTLYHDPMTKNFDGVDEDILRFTEKSRQHLIYYSPIWRLAQNFNFAELFKSSAIPEINGHAVSSWMSIGTDVYDESMELDIKPAIPVDYNLESKRVHIPMVLGFLYSDDAIAINWRMDREATSPLEASKLVYQTFYHKRWSAISDYTEQSILYILEDEKADFVGDGATTEFEIEGAEKITSVTVNGEAVTDYTFEDGTLTFTEAPADAAIINVEYI